MRVEKNIRIYVQSVVISLLIVMSFFAFQAIVIIKEFRPELAFVPLSLGVFIGIIIGKIILLRRQLEKKERVFKAIADQASEFSYFRLLDGNYEYVSPSSSTVTGYEQVDFYEQAHFMNRLIHKDDLHLWENHVHHMNENGEPEVLEVRILHHDGSVRWIEHKCSNVHEDGELIGVRSVNVDIIPTATNFIT